MLARHRHQESIGFLNQIEPALPAGKLIQAILDNTPPTGIPRWRPPSAPHIPLYADRPLGSIPAIEGFFAKLTGDG